jgi:hypothetical protein
MLNEADAPQNKCPIYGVSIFHLSFQPSLERDILLSVQGFFCWNNSKPKKTPSVKRAFLSQKRVKNMILGIASAVRRVAAAATPDLRHYCSIQITFFNS